MFDYCNLLIMQFEILIDALRAMVSNLLKENFYEKKKKINVLTAFSIFHKSGVKTFLK